MFGIVGAAIAIGFAFFLKLLKKQAKRIHKTDVGIILLATTGGVIIGLVGMMWPATLFWSENEMQTVLSRGEEPLPYVYDQMNSVMDDLGYTHIPFRSYDLLSIAVVKLFVIAVTVAAGYPGGIVFPLFYSGAAFGYFFAIVFNLSPTLCMITLMGAVEAAITRTGWATCVILVQIQGGFLINKVYDEGMEMETHYLAVFPVLVIAVTTSTILSRWVNFYPQQQNRPDLHKEGDDEMRMYHTVEYTNGYSSGSEDENYFAEPTFFEDDPVTSVLESDDAALLLINAEDNETF
eukprot:TRINITY_DN3069_c0_g2_i1.p1 TRINITY_DN3069_c0_g2~~TRINITY_DN3069_c0_g2_i1.p1  ORF type:complete len:292 (-),score=42.05 TRINITY_DN3069_c0_g2_i1:95-970(-)